MKYTKKILNIIVAILLLCSFPVSALNETNSKEQNEYSAAIERLKGLGIISDQIKEFNPVDRITRVEFTTLLVRSMGMDDVQVNGNYFTDIDEKYWAKDNINFAYKAGLLDWVNSSRFEPEKKIEYSQALNMLVCAVGYKDLINDDAYRQSVATVQSEITKGVVVDSSKSISKKTAAELINNILEIPLLTKTENIGEVKYSKSGTGDTTERTILTDYLRIERIYVQIVDVNLKNRTITIVHKDNNEKITYDVDKKINMTGLVSCYADIYVCVDDDVICYIEINKKTDVLYDFIHAVNRNEDKSAAYYPHKIESIHLRNANEEYSLEDAQIYYNDELMENKANIFTDCFAKVVVHNGEIKKLEVYPLMQGGIIKTVNTDEIKFTRGERNENIIGGFYSANEVQVYIDGKPFSSILDLKSDMTFDYYRNNEKDKYVIIASTRMITQTLNSISGNSLLIGVEEYEYDENNIFFYSEIEKRYLGNYDLSKLLGKLITIFIDDNKYVRYIKEVKDYDKSVFYGVITKAEQKDNGLSEISYFKIFRITGKQEEGVYPVRKKMKNSPIDYELAKKYAGSITGSSFLKFTLNTKGEIYKIEPVEYFGNAIDKITAFADTDWAYIENIYIRKSTIFAVYPDEYGDLKVKILSYDNDIRNTTIENISASNYIRIITDFDIKDNPIPRFVMLTTNSGLLHKNNTESRIITKITKQLDDKYKLLLVDNTKGNVNVYVNEDFMETHNLKQNMFIYYFNSITGSNPIIIRKENGQDSIFDLSLPSDQWATNTFSRSAQKGFFAADSIKFFSDQSIQFMVNGEPTDVYYMIDDEFQVYELKEDKQNGRFVNPSSLKSKLANIEEGDKVWFNVIDWPGPRSVNLIIYKKP